MASQFSHKLPEEHLYEGILFFGFSPPETLDAVKDFQVRDDDVFIVTYPKAGLQCTCILCCSEPETWRFLQRSGNEINLRPLNSDEIHRPQGKDEGTQSETEKGEVYATIIEKFTPEDAEIVKLLETSFVVCPSKVECKRRFSLMNNITSMCRQEAKTPTNSYGYLKFWQDFIVCFQVDKCQNYTVNMISGTTWLQEIVWLIMHDGDFECAAKDPVYFRCPFLEFKDDVLHEVGIDLANPMPSPRVIKSHLPVKLMPRQLFQGHKGKILLLFRNPKDLCVSYYHFYRSSSSLGNFKGTFHEFLHMFVEGHVDHGSWFDFTRSWWAKRHEANVYILFYEDMKRDLKQCILRLCEFLNKPLSEDLVDGIVEHSSFESMSMNPMTNHLDVYSINSKISPQLRKGIVGDWKSHFTVGQNELFDRIYEEKIGDLNIPFLYELE